MITRGIAKKAYPIAAAVAVGAYVFVWLTDKRKGKNQKKWGRLH